MKTLNEIFDINLNWKQEIAKNHMYTNVWYEGCTENDENRISMRFLYYVLQAPITKMDIKCHPIYKKKAFPLSIEFDGFLSLPEKSCSLTGIYGIGTEEYYALFELLSKHFERIKQIYNDSYNAVYHFLENITTHNNNNTGTSMLLYEYDYTFINTILALTKENKIEWKTEHDVYIGDIIMFNGIKTTIEIRRVWIEAENQCGRDPYLYKIITPQFTRVFFLGTKIGSMIYEIIYTIKQHECECESRMAEYIQYVTLIQKSKIV